MRQLHRLLGLIMRDAVRRTLIKRHRDINAEPRLNVDRCFRRKKMRRPVDVRSELDPFFAQLTNRRERENLKPAGVGEHGAIPRHELVHAAKLLDQIDAGAQH